MKKQVFFIFLFLLCVLFGASCTRDKNPSGPIPEEPDRGKYIRGTVVLENQTNYASCFVWVDSLWIGTVSDSSGYFEIPIPDSLDSTSGVFTLYHHIECFKWAALELELSEGKIVPGKYDVENSGLMKPVFLDELASIALTTDKTVYSASGDTIRYTIRVQNLSEEEIRFISDGLIFYNLSSDTVTVYKPFYYPAGPPGVWIAPGTTYNEDGVLLLPIDQSYPYWDYYRLPDGLIPAGKYFFTNSFGIRYPPYFDIDIDYRRTLFLLWTSCQYPTSFVILLGWVPIFNIYDSKNISFAQITIIP